MATTTNFGWVTPDNTSLVKDGAAAIRTLGSSIDSTMAELKGGTTGQVLSKTTGTDMDFTWVTTDDTNAIQNAIVDAKGDLIAASGADTPARLAVGANDLLVTAASGEATGLKYSGAWTTWTPSYTNITVGNGTVDARWCRIGKVVNVYWRFTLGSTSSIGAVPQFTLPVGADYPQRSSNGILTDQGTANYVGYAQIEGGTLYPSSILSNGTYASVGSVNSTTPFTWTNTDVMYFSVSYEA